MYLHWPGTTFTGLKDDIIQLPRYVNPVVLDGCVYTHPTSLNKHGFMSAILEMAVMDEHRIQKTMLRYT